MLAPSFLSKEDIYQWLCLKTVQHLMRNIELVVLGKGLSASFRVLVPGKDPH